MVDGESLIELTETHYASEAVLQKLLATHPRLLSGDSSESPQRWMLVKREAALAHDNGSSTWSVDHVFLDQDGVPTIVEVKQSSNAEIRRSIVGQMLDYAANALVYWPVEHLKATFETACELSDIDPNARIAELIGPGEKIDEFWARVQTNLEAQRIRLVFVADRIPPELRRVIEFLNGQMRPVEVLGVEVKQYVGQNSKTLVPRLVGQTAEAQQKKAAASAISQEPWTWERYEQELGIKPERIAIGRELVTLISDAAADLKLSMLKGHASFLRASGYKVAGVDLWYRQPPRFSVKIPDAPQVLGLANPYPNLTTDWNSEHQEWGWHIASIEAIPDPRPALDLVRPYHPASGPMRVPPQLP
jgi:hypothetical protein